MGDGKVCFQSEVVHILIYLIAQIRGRMLNAGLIEAVMSPLVSDENKRVHLDGIEFAARMAFDGKVAENIVNYNSSLDTDEIRGLIDWRHCMRFVHDGFKDADWYIRYFSWRCAESFVEMGVSLSPTKVSSGPSQSHRGINSM
jgi:hypothetical protein